MVPERSDISPGRNSGSHLHPRLGKSHECDLTRLTLLSVSTASDVPARKRRDASIGATAIKTAAVLVSIVTVVASPSAVADLSPGDAGNEPTPYQQPTGRDVVRTTLPRNPPTEEEPISIARPENPCSLSPTKCANVPRPRQLPPPTAVGAVASCVTAGLSEPRGTLTTVPGTSAATGAQIVRFRVEIEDGLAIGRNCFGYAVTSILIDEKGWSADGSVGFERVDDESYDFRLILASPDTTNALCYPAATGSKYSCRNQDKVVLNLVRWESGVDDFGGDLDTYRRYLVNHEVGHLLGKGHRSCPGRDRPAPVMMQQSKGVAECLPNGWPTQDER